MYLRHELDLDAPTEKGGTRRAMLELSAKRGNADAIQALAPVEYPVGMTYLLDWSRELVGRSGSDMNGTAPLSWETIDAWARRTSRNPTYEECMALIELDRAWLRRETSQEIKADEQPKVAEIRAWPTRKAD